jgi:hypothetical protein
MQATTANCGLPQILGNHWRPDPLGRIDLAQMDHALSGKRVPAVVYSCRLDTSRVPTAIAELEKCLDQAVAAVVLESAEWS